MPFSQTTPRGGLKQPEANASSAVGLTESLLLVCDLFIFTADPGRLGQHHQPHLKTLLLQEETCHHFRGPQHQVCPAAHRQTGKHFCIAFVNTDGWQHLLFAVFTNAADAFMLRSFCWVFTCFFHASLHYIAVKVTSCVCVCACSDRKPWHQEVQVCSALSWTRPRPPHRWVTLRPALKPL